MSSLDNILSDVKVVAGEVGKKANEYMEISRLRLERVTVKGDIQKNFAKIGELVYNAHRSGEEGEEVVGIYLDEIDDQYKRLDEISARMTELQRRAHCPACGAQNEVGAAFCSRCGAKLGGDEEEAAAPEDKAEAAVVDAAETAGEAVKNTADEIKDIAED